MSVKLRVVAALTTICAACTVSFPVHPDPAAPASAFAGRNLDVVILGDSFISGKANGPYEPGVVSYCYQSAESWAKKLVRTLHGVDGVTGSVTDVSCNGATTSGVRYGQITAVTADTDLVLLQVGGNDLSVDLLLLNCLLGCDPEAEYQDAVARLGAIRKNLLGIIDAVHARAPKATVLLSDYPDLVGDPESWNGASCLGFVTPEMGRALRKLTAEGAAMYAGLKLRLRVATVSMRDAVRGHNHCDVAEPWISGLTHYERDGTKRTILEIHAFHPMDAAHQATATAARQRLIEYYASR